MRKGAFAPNLSKSNAPRCEYADASGAHPNRGGALLVEPSAVRIDTQKPNIGPIGVSTSATYGTLLAITLCMEGISNMHAEKKSIGKTGSGYYGGEKRKDK